MRLRFFLIALLAMAGSTYAQDETKLGADFRKEGGALAKDCSSFKSFLSCGRDTFHRPPIAHRCWQYCSTEWIWGRRCVRCSSKSAKTALASNLEC